MRIIIEEYKYAAADVKDVLKGIDALENVEGYVSVNYVGYFYNPDKDADDIVSEWLALGVNVPNFVETQSMFDERKQNSKDSRINEKAKIASLANGQTIYVSNQYNTERIADVIAKVNGTNWNIIISKV